VPTELQASNKLKIIQYPELPMEILENILYEDCIVPELDWEDECLPINEKLPSTTEE